MSRMSSIYPDFDSYIEEPESEDDDLAEHKLKSFEDGYEAGWVDAVKATESDQDAILSEFKQNLDDNAFTYQEALGKLTTALKPMLHAIVSKVLPRTLDAGLALHMAENLEALIKDQLVENASVSLNPRSKSLIEEKLAEMDHKVPLTLISDAALGDGQLQFRVGHSELDINFDALLAGLNTAIDAHFSQ